MAWPKASFKKLFVLPAMKPELAFGIGKFFYGITKSRAWHIGKVSIQEVPQYVRIFLPNFAQHPAYGLVNEVVGTVEQLSVYVFTSSGVLLLRQKDLSR